MRSAQTPRGRSDQAGSQSNRFRRARGERGVALVEFAIIAPFLFLILFGIIEFGWAFFQNLDVRHGARETARLAAVNYPDTSTTCTPGGSGSCNDTLRTTLLTEACTRMDKGSGIQIRAFRTTGPQDASTNYEIGDTITVQVRKDLEQITGFLAPFLNNVKLKSNIDIRIEQPARWASLGTAGDGNGWFSCP
jgi:Flp pilus assembly protein TadG